MRIGIFELREGATSERAHRFSATIAAIDYPWRRIIPRLRDDPDQAVVVLWDALRQGITGLYYGGNRIEIHLSESTGSYTVGQEPFVIAHEIGHLVDHTTLTRTDRDDLLALFHADPEAAPWAGAEDPNNPGEPFEWSHDNPHRETWRGSSIYALRPNEAYADAFVEGFAPTVWIDQRRHRRFAHATDDLAEVRRLTLREEIMTFDDVGPDHPHRESIERAAELGLVAGYPDGTYRPEAGLTRGQAATIAVRQYDRILEEATR